MSIPPASAGPRRSGPHRSQVSGALSILGWVLLAAWAMWWAQSVYEGRLFAGRVTWVPAFPSLGLDFTHNYLAVHHWIGGGDPFRETFNDPRGIRYNYPPIVLVLFLWCAPLDFVTATLSWTAAVAVVVALGAWSAWRSRRRLGLPRLPRPFVLGAALLATGTVFSMERGNCDALVIPLLIGAAAALRGRALRHDLLAGTCLALATWIKIYPGLVIPWLLVLRRPRAFSLSVAVAALIGAIEWPWTVLWIQNVRADVAWYANFPVVHVAHSLSTAWGPLMRTAGLEGLARVPGVVAAAVLLAPLAGWVAFHAWRAAANRDDAALVYPLFLWAAQLATFWQPISYDYKLIFLPLAALAVWTSRERWWTWALLVPFVLHWQPLRFPVSAEWLLGFKISGLVAVATMLVARIGERSAQTLGPSRSGPM